MGLEDLQALSMVLRPSRPPCHPLTSPLRPPVCRSESLPPSAPEVQVLHGSSCSPCWDLWGWRTSNGAGGPRLGIYGSGGPPIDI